GEFGEVRELVAEAGVNVAGFRGKSRAEGRGGCVADHRRQFWVTRLDAAVHVKRRARAEVEKLDNVADSRRVEFAKQVQVRFGDGDDFVHGAEFTESGTNFNESREKDWHGP